MEKREKKYLQNKSEDRVGTGDVCSRPPGVVPPMATRGAVHITTSCLRKSLVKVSDYLIFEVSMKVNIQFDMFEPK